MFENGTASRSAPSSLLRVSDSLSRALGKLGVRKPRRRPRPFKPGQSGNLAGRPQGSRNRVTLALEGLIDGEGERLTRRAVKMAMGGDGAVMRALLDRLIPPKRERAVNVALPSVSSIADLPAAIAAVIAAVSASELLPAEGEAFASMLTAQRQTLETAELAARITALEARLTQEPRRE